MISFDYGLRRRSWRYDELPLHPGKLMPGTLQR